MKPFTSLDKSIANLPEGIIHELNADFKNLMTVLVLNFLAYEQSSPSEIVDLTLLGKFHF